MLAQDVQVIRVNMSDSQKDSQCLTVAPRVVSINENSIINAIKPSKDVDGFSIPNVGLLSTSVSGLIPCTPLGCLLLLKSYVGELSGKSAVIIGRSNIVGKPMAQLLLEESCTVTIVHSKTRNIEEITKQADKEFYKTRPFLKLVLNIYFLPYNLLRLARYLRIRHEYKKNEIEMEVLTKKLKEDRNWRSYENK